MAITLTQPGTGSTGWASPVNQNFQLIQDWLNNGVAKAWVNFDGTTTIPAMRANFNVASVTRNGVGDFTVNFTTPMANANYVITFAFNGISHALLAQMFSSNMTVGSFRFNVVQVSNSGTYDPNTALISVFGQQ